MKQHQLTIDIADGKWVVDVFSTTGDDGKFDLIAPAKEAALLLKDNTLYGFSYHISAPAMTSYTICLDDTVLAEGMVDDSGINEGRGVL